MFNATICLNCAVISLHLVVLKQRKRKKIAKAICAFHNVELGPYAIQRER